MLHIHNSLTGRKEPFKPIGPGEVRMYVCGMTVYDYCHIGHAPHADRVRRACAASCARRGYRVTYVRNITDIDDKIIKRAQRERRADRRRSPSASSARCTRTARRSACATPRPRAARHRSTCREMVAMIGRLDRQAATPTSARNGDVYYAVRELRAATASCRASARRPARRRARRGRRGASAIRSTSCCGRRAKPGEPAWDSPWGQGRPGWHIECSAMSVDAARASTSTSTAAAWTCKFPHHENEIAQTCAALRLRSSSTSGCTTASCASTTRRCRSRSATSSPCATCWTRCATRRSCAFSCCAATTAGRSTIRSESLDAGGCGARAAVHRAARTSTPRSGAGVTDGDAALSRGDGRRLQHAGGDRRAAGTRAR